jgi:hypothetical protein
MWQKLRFLLSDAACMITGENTVVDTGWLFHNNKFKIGNEFG